MSTLSRSADGFAWTPKGKVEGLPTAAVTLSTRSLGQEYDVIVIGAGFAGLVAARDTGKHGKVLLLDARDRIGGRTWTAEVFGQQLEMGGTWLHWNQPHAYTEMHRYGLHKNLKISNGPSAGEDVYYRYQGTAKRWDPATFDAKCDKIIEAFLNVDGLTLHDYLPRPHEPMRYPEIYAKYDQMSVQDRLDQLDFDGESKAILSTLTGGIGLSQPKDIGFMEAANWFALSGGTNAGINEYCSTYKLGNGGTTSLARAIFEDFQGDFAANAVVAHVAQTSTGVDVTLKDGRRFRSSHVISTIPLNVLPTLHFEPALSPLKTEASEIGMVTRGTKVHFEFASKRPSFFTGADSGSPFGFSFSDHHGAHGDKTYSIGFGNTGHLLDVKNAGTVLNAYKQHFPHEVDLSGYAIHDWRHDPFALSAWCCFRKEFASKYLLALQEPHGDRVFMASADWADGWRGFIDGAIEQGTRNARHVIQRLRSVERSPASGLRAHL